MVVYIEYVLLNNLLVTFMLLFCTNVLLKEKNNKKRVLFACVFGAGMALVYPLIGLSGVLNLLLKLLIGFLISVIGYGGKTLKKQFAHYTIYMFLTAMYGGVNLMIYYSIYGDFSCTKTLPLPIIIFSVFVISYFIKQIYKVLYQKKQLSKFVYNIEICENNNKVETTGYLDSGNILCDPKTNLPIIIINHKLFNRLFKDFSPINLLTNQIQNLKNAHYIEVGTVTTNAKMLVFCVDKITLKMPQGNKDICSPVLGLSQNSFKHLCCDVLLNAKLI